MYNATHAEDNSGLPAILLEFPIPIVKWANLTSLQPAGNAVKVESMIAHSPGYCALLRVNIDRIFLPACNYCFKNLQSPHIMATTFSFESSAYGSN